MIQNQEEVNTAGDNAEHVFKCADIYIDVDDGLCAVNFCANEGASTSNGREFEFFDNYIKDLDGIQTIEDRVLE